VDILPGYTTKGFCGSEHRSKSSGQDDLFTSLLDEGGEKRESEQQCDLYMSETDLVVDRILWSRRTEWRPSFVGWEINVRIEKARQSESRSKFLHIRRGEIYCKAMHGSSEKLRRKELVRSILVKWVRVGKGGDSNALP
jgi:hypothetical protein